MRIATSRSTLTLTLLAVLSLSQVACRQDEVGQAESTSARAVALYVTSPGDDPVIAAASDGDEAPASETETPSADNEMPRLLRRETDECLIEVIADEYESLEKFFQNQHVMIGSLQAIGRNEGEWDDFCSGKAGLAEEFVNYPAFNDDPEEQTYGCVIDIEPLSERVRRLLQARPNLTAVGETSHWLGGSLIFVRTRQEPARYRIVGHTTVGQIFFFSNEHAQPRGVGADLRMLPRQ